MTQESPRRPAKLLRYAHKPHVLALGIRHPAAQGSSSHGPAVASEGTRQSPRGTARLRRRPSARSGGPSA